MTYIHEKNIHFIWSFFQINFFPNLLYYIHFGNCVIEPIYFISHLPFIIIFVVDGDMLWVPLRRLGDRRTRKTRFKIYLYSHVMNWIWFTALLVMFLVQFPPTVDRRESSPVTIIPIPSFLHFLQTYRFSSPMCPTVLIVTMLQWLRVLVDLVE